MTSLNPVLSIGRQMIDIQHRERRSLREKRERAADMLARVGLPDATSRLSAYPHQFSGGMRQRIAIAIAPTTEPDIPIPHARPTAIRATTLAPNLAIPEPPPEACAGESGFVTRQ